MDKKKIIFKNNYSFNYKNLHYTRIRLHSFLNYNYDDFYEINYHNKEIYKTSVFGTICGNEHYFILTDILLKDDKFIKYFFMIIKQMKEEKERKFFESIKEWKQVKKWLFYYE
ncbi:MAG: hypothetical protein JXB50_07950 [Spirochaetes bacterium]|nr:hypothetical protein [Spirochaetota bacterium]